jgi:hypothetical protein
MVNHPNRSKKALLVYQAGIANIFEVATFNLHGVASGRKRILQGDFRTCENFARGLAFAGWHVGSVGCNKAGDIIHETWTDDLESLPFSDKFSPVFNKVEH